MLVLIQLLEGSSEQVSWQPIRGIFRSSRIVFLDRLCIPQDDEDQSGMIALGLHAVRVRYGFLAWLLRRCLVLLCSGFRVCSPCVKKGLAA